MEEVIAITSQFRAYRILFDRLNVKHAQLLEKWDQVLEFLRSEPDLSGEDRDLVERYNQELIREAEVLTIARAEISLEVRTLMEALNRIIHRA